MKVFIVAGARPNFMKIGPVYRAAAKYPSLNCKIIHTGQHYDLNMSDVFFRDLGLPEPNIHLGVGSGTHAEQSGQVMISYEKVLIDRQPDLVVVVGDVNSTMAATLAAVKLGIKTAHLEAGLRSFDRSMPEEINRLVTDALADILWTPSADGDENLIREGVSREKIQRVGNIMIDSLEMLRDKIQDQTAYSDFGLELQQYGLVTLHRPSNVDAPKKLAKLFDLLSRISKKIPLVFPIHPRTRKSADQIGILSQLDQSKELILLDPLNYVRFMNLVFNCRFALTDSGGIQEETTILKVPCITLRPNTERPITAEIGTSRIVGNDPQKIVEAWEDIQNDRWQTPTTPEMWDGKAAERIVSVIVETWGN